MAADLNTLFAGLPRRGPGSDAITADAFRRIRDAGLRPEPRILDVGCGEGRSTLALGRLSGGLVTGSDIDGPGLEAARARAAAQGLGERVRFERRGMEDLSVPPGSIDLIWSEGAIYIIGFENGLERWRPMLTPRGFIAVSECCWLTEARPPEVVEYFAAENFTLHPIRRHLETAERLGYRALDTIVFPSAAWWEEFYTPMLARIAEFRETKSLDPAWTTLLDGMEAEADLHRRYGATYGYVFYLLQRRD